MYPSLGHDVEFRQDFLQVAVHFDLLEDIVEFALFIDNERRALDAHEFPAVQRFFFPHAVGLQHGFLFIAEQGEIEIELFHKLLVRVHGISADPQHHGAAGVNFIQAVTKGA